jgi:hypothetical protein
VGLPLVPHMVLYAQSNFNFWWLLKRAVSVHLPIPHARPMPIHHPPSSHPLRRAISVSMTSAFVMALPSTTYHVLEEEKRRRRGPQDTAGDGWLRLWASRKRKDLGISGIELAEGF